MGMKQPWPGGASSPGWQCPGILSLSEGNGNLMQMMWPGAKTKVSIAPGFISLLPLPRLWALRWDGSEFSNTIAIDSNSLCETLLRSPGSQPQLFVPDVVLQWPLVTNTRVLSAYGEQNQLEGQTVRCCPCSGGLLPICRASCIACALQQSCLVRKDEKMARDLPNYLLEAAQKATLSPRIHFQVLHPSVPPSR